MLVKLLPHTLCACLALIAFSANAAESNPFSSAKQGVLSVRIELSGDARRDQSNKIEWRKMHFSRVMDIKIPMIAAGTTGSDVATGRMDPDAEMDVEAPEGYDDIQAAMEACGEDMSCKMRTGMKFGQMMQAGQMKAPTAPVMPDNTRYQYWHPATTGACAQGSIKIADRIEGVEIDPATGAFPYTYIFSGAADLSDRQATEAFCGTVISIDQKTGLYSVRIYGLNTSVKGRYLDNGAQRFAAESASFVNINASKSQYHNTLLLSGMKLESGKRSFQGKKQIQNFGTAPFFNHEMDVPLKADVTWSFEAR